MEYVVGRIYMTIDSGPVIYKGYCHIFKRHKFVLKNVDDTLFYYEGDPPDYTEGDELDTYLGEIYEYTPGQHSTQPTHTGGQSKRWSFIETISGVIIGFAVALLIQIIIFPMFDITTSFSENFTIAGVFTVASIVRGYYVRRLFSWMRNVKGIGT